MTQRIYLVTGSSRGIGLGLVRELISRGHKVISVCRNPESASELEKVLSENGQPKPVKCDVASDVSVTECFCQVWSCSISIHRPMVGSSNLESKQDLFIKELFTRNGRNRSDFCCPTNFAWLPDQFFLAAHPIFVSIPLTDITLQKIRRRDRKSPISKSVGEPGKIRKVGKWMSLLSAHFRDFLITIIR